MRYWGFFAAKLGVSAAVLYGLLGLLNLAWPAEPRFLSYSPPRFGYNLPYTLSGGAMDTVLFWRETGVGRLCRSQADAAGDGRNQRH